VVLPDTQHYSEAYPEIFFSQTQWIVENIAPRNIVFVSHLGDLVQNNDYFEEEWKIADKAMQTLDGRVAYAVVPGNHDMQYGGEAKFYKSYFPESRFSENIWWGGSFNDNKNNYQLISQGGDNYVILNLQYCPPDSAIDWANSVLAEYSDHKAILTTHSYLHNNGRRVGHCQEKSDGENSGFDIWKKIIRQNPNIFLTLSGHIPGASRRSDAVDGRVVYQLLSDYQDLSNGGDGYLRIMTFQPNQDNIHVTTYSPVLDEYLVDSENEFDLPFDMTGGRLPSGKITVHYGSDRCTTNLTSGYCEFVVSNTEPANFTASYTGNIYF
jgi:3',5'-cyclic AMP phosphodiesterase CpdA